MFIAHPAHIVVQMLSEASGTVSLTDDDAAGNKLAKWKTSLADAFGQAKMGRLVRLAGCEPHVSRHIPENCLLHLETFEGL
jgi:hypothetical protein